MREAGEFPKGLELLGQRTGLFIFPNIFLRIPKPVLYEGQRLLLDFFVLCAVCFSVVTPTLSAKSVTSQVLSVSVHWLQAVFAVPILKAGHLHIKHDATPSAPIRQYSRWQYAESWFANHQYTIRRRNRLHHIRCSSERFCACVEHIHEQWSPLYYCGRCVC